MQPVIYELKREILELESVSYSRDSEKIAKILKRIRAICDELDNANIEFSEPEIEYMRINRLPFLYKPILRKDYFKGDYLEKFALERTMQLKEADALSVHNHFWRNHEDIKGNVFGSVPVEMISQNAASKLLQMGWRETEVNIIDLKDQSIEEKRISKFCEKVFDQFILVKEKATGTYLVLEYEV